MFVNRAHVLFAEQVDAYCGALMGNTHKWPHNVHKDKAEGVNFPTGSQLL